MSRPVTRTGAPTVASPPATVEVGWSPSCCSRRSSVRLMSSLLGRGLAALAARFLLLLGGTALLGGAARRAAARARLLATAAGRAGRVGDLGRPLLGHPFVLQGLVLFLVLDVGALRRHAVLPCIDACLLFARFGGWTCARLWCGPVSRRAVIA